MKKYRYIITVNSPDEISKIEMQEYILESIQTMRGCCHPEDHLFTMNNSDFKVTQFKEVYSKC